MLPWTQNIPECAAAQEYGWKEEGGTNSLTSEAPLELEAEKPVGNEQGVRVRSSEKIQHQKWSHGDL